MYMPGTVETTLTTLEMTEKMKGWCGESVLEELGTKVEDEVDTGELLEGLNEDTSERAEEVSAVVVLEAVEVRAGRLGELEVKVGLDDRDLGADKRVVNVGRVRRASDLAAFSWLPFLINQRGDSGRIKKKPQRMMAQTNWIPTGIRQAEVFVRFWVPLVARGSSKETDGDGPLVNRKQRHHGSNEGQSRTGTWGH